MSLSSQHQPAPLRATLSAYTTPDNAALALADGLSASDRAAISKVLDTAGLLDLAALFHQGSTSTPASVHEQLTLYIPCYNGARYLEAILPSVMAQSVMPKEIIVVDDGSTDDTVAVASRFPIKIVRHTKNSGLASARNTAIAQATTPYLACLDADVAPDRYWLERLMPLFSDSKVAGVGGRLIEQHTLSIADRWRARMMAQHYGNFPVSNQPVFGCNGVFRLDVLRHLGGYTKAYTRSFEDIDLSKRLLSAGYETRYNPDALCRHQRKDSPRSVVDTCFFWRLPHLLGLGATESPTGLAGALGTNLRYDLKEIDELASTNDLVLGYPSLLMLFRSPLRLVEVVAQKLPAAEALSLRVAAAALLLRAVQLLEAPPPMRSCLLADLKDLLEIQGAPSELFPIASSAEFIKHPEIGLSSLGSVTSSYLAPIVGVLKALPDVARFKPEIVKGLSASALGVEGEVSAAQRPPAPLPISFSKETSTAGYDSVTRRCLLSFHSHTALERREQLAGAEVSGFEIVVTEQDCSVGLWWALFLSSIRKETPLTVACQVPANHFERLKNSPFLQALNSVACFKLEHRP